MPTLALRVTSDKSLEIYSSNFIEWLIQWKKRHDSQVQTKSIHRLTQLFLEYLIFVKVNKLINNNNSNKCCICDGRISIVLPATLTSLWTDSNFQVWAQL